MIDPVTDAQTGRIQFAKCHERVCLAAHRVISVGIAAATLAGKCAYFQPTDSIRGRGGSIPKRRGARRFQGNARISARFAKRPGMRWCSASGTSVSIYLRPRYGYKGEDVVSG